MFRRIAPLLAVLVLAAGCAGTAKLTQKSEEKLASGDHWKAWQLATRALDREPGNPGARNAATAAGASIAEEWQRRIQATAALDSVDAAEEVLKFVEFRAHAARYCTIPTATGWPEEERALRRAAARMHYARGTTASAAKRPKQACLAFRECERFVTNYRDAAVLAEKAFTKALTNVAVVPFRSSGNDAPAGTQIAEVWRTDLSRALAPPHAEFTRIMGGDDIERSMNVSQLKYLSRDDALALARKAGAQRAVWGSVGGVKSTTRLELFKDHVARRVTEVDAEGRKHVRWIDVPIEVVARIRDVTVGVDYEVLSTRNGASVARRHLDRTTSARVVWTSYQPEADVETYALVSETTRSSNAARARDGETRWKAVCGEGTTIAQVLEARLASGSSGSTGRYGRDSLPRFIAGAAFVFLQELPPTEDLALAAVAQGSGALRDDLLRLDAVDDVDLGVSVTSSDSR
jgi:hypothetical protein